MEIKLEPRLEAFICKVCKVEKAEIVVQKVVADWIGNLLNSEFQKVATGEDLIAVIEKNSPQTPLVEADTIKEN